MCGCSLVGTEKGRQGGREGGREGGKVVSFAFCFVGAASVKA